MRWVSLLALLLPGVADAKASSELGYAVPEAYSTSIRFVRVDRGCKVLDKDADAAYLSFECKGEAGKPSRGSLEIFKTGNAKKERVKIQVTLPDEPHYIELRFIELLERKLRDERGTPAPAPDPPKSEPSDGGTSEGSI